MSAQAGDTYELIWRVFKTTLIHERVLRLQNDDLTEKTIVGSKMFDRPTNHIEPCDSFDIQQRRSIKPRPGGLITIHNDKKWCVVYMDDLFLCPNCSEFYPHRRDMTDVAWMNHRKPSIQGMMDTVFQKLSSPEFEIKPCCKKKSLIGV